MFWFCLLSLDSPEYMPFSTRAHSRPLQCQSNHSHKTSTWHILIICMVHIRRKWRAGHGQFPNMVGTVLHIVQYNHNILTKTHSKNATFENRNSDSDWHGNSIFRDVLLTKYSNWIVLHKWDLLKYRPVPYLEVVLATVPNHCSNMIGYSQRNNK